MANTNSPFGFRSFGHRDGNSPTMGLERRFITSSDTNLYFTGDPVCNSSALPGFIQPYSGSSLAPVCAGIFAGCEYYSPSVGRVVWNSYFPAGITAAANASAAVNAYVITDPDMLFIVQTTSAALGSSTIGYNANITSALSSLGNTLTGISAVTLAGGALLGGSSQPFRIVDVSSKYFPPNTNGNDSTTNYNVVVVAPNNWDRKALTGVST